MRDDRGTLFSFPAGMLATSALLRCAPLGRPSLCALCRHLLSRDVIGSRQLLRDVTARQLSGGVGSGGGYNKRLRSTLYYVTAMGVLVGGLSYAAVPLYRIFCQVRPSVAAGADWSCEILRRRDCGCWSRSVRCEAGIEINPHQ